MNRTSSEAVPPFADGDFDFGPPTQTGFFFRNPDFSKLEVLFAKFLSLVSLVKNTYPPFRIGESFGMEGWWGSGSPDFPWCFRKPSNSILVKKIDPSIFRVL